MRNKIYKYIYIAILLALALLLIAKLSGPAILRLYISSGVGSCQKIPILCMAPSEEIIAPAINKEYIRELSPCEFPNVTLSIPKGFNVIQEKIKKVYYKKRKREDNAATIYLFQQGPNFFTGLFPQLRNKGVRDDYQFIKRVMYAQSKDVKDLTDTFFVVMKGIFIPDLGDQRGVKMAQFSVADKRAFINYNLGYPDNYFDCNIVNEQGHFFKIYIKDIGASLDLDKVLAIVSTASAK